jgi:hypothetical protein
LTSQVYGEKEVQVDDEASGKSLHSMKKVREENIIDNTSHFLISSAMYSTRSNQLFRTHDFPCLYMKRKQSSLRNKLEGLTSDCGALDLMHLLDPHK